MLNEKNFTWFLNHIYEILILGIVLRYLRTVLNIFVIEPLQGDDGKTQVEELAKYVIVLLIIYVFHKEGTRVNEWRYFSDETILFLLIGLFGIAALKLDYSKGLEAIGRAIGRIKSKDNDTN